MSKRGKRKALKKYSGVYVRETRAGKTYDICYRRDDRLIWEKVGRAPAVTPQAAHALRGKRLGEVQAHEELPTDRRNMPTLDAVWAPYLEWAKESKRSWRDDQLRYDKHLKDRFGSLKVDKIFPFHLERLKRDLRVAGLAPATVRQVLALVRAIYNAGMKRGKKGGRARGMIPRNVTNPVDEVEFPDVDNERERFLSEDEAARLLRELEKRSRVAYELAAVSLATGARLGELTGLRWADVDLEHRTLALLDTKNRSTRRLSLNERAYKIFAAKEVGEVGDHVWTKGDGTPMTQAPDVFRRVANELFNRALPRGDRRHRVTFHTLRHSCASWLVIRGHSLFIVGQILGHRTPTMTQRYAHLAPDASRAALATLDVPLGGDDDCMLQEV